MVDASALVSHPIIVPSTVSIVSSKDWIRIGNYILSNLPVYSRVGHLVRVGDLVSVQLGHHRLGDTVVAKASPVQVFR